MILTIKFLVEQHDYSPWNWHKSVFPDEIRCIPNRPILFYRLLTIAEDYYVMNDWTLINQSELTVRRSSLVFCSAPVVLSLAYNRCEHTYVQHSVVHYFSCCISVEHTDTHTPNIIKLLSFMMISKSSVIHSQTQVKFTCEHLALGKMRGKFIF